MQETINDPTKHAPVNTHADRCSYSYRNALCLSFRLMSAGGGCVDELGAPRGDGLPGSLAWPNDHPVAPDSGHPGTGGGGGAGDGGRGGFADTGGGPEPRPPPSFDIHELRLWSWKNSPLPKPGTRSLTLDTPHHPAPFSPIH